MIRALYWNGGLSHVLSIEGERVKIYQCLDEFDWEDNRVDDWEEKILKFPSFLNEEKPSFVLDDVIKSEIYEGSALLHRSNGTFILVEKTIREIHLLSNDEFVSFESNNGGGTVPYSHIKGYLYTYILSEKSRNLRSYCAYRNSLFNEESDVYEVFYDKQEEGIPFHSDEIKNLESCVSKIKI